MYFLMQACFFLGVCIIVLPFCIYFKINDALYEMWYGTLLYNFEYTAKSSLVLKMDLHDIISMIRITLPGWCLIGAAGWKLIIKRNYEAFFWLAIAVLNVVFIYSLNRYWHYSICLFPYFYISIFLMKSGNESLITVERKLTDFFRICIIGVCIVSSVYFLYRNPIEFGLKECEKEYAELLKSIPNAEKESFVAFDVPVDIYLEENMQPASRYFILQSWQASCSKNLTISIQEEFSKCDVKWILVQRDDGEKLIIDDILENNYECVAESAKGRYYLYNLK